MNQPGDAIEPLVDALEAETKGLALDLSGQHLPLDITIRSMALTLAVRHTGDRTVKEGNLYQQLKMDGKLSGPLNEEHVVNASLIFERYLWGEWSKSIAGQALSRTLDAVANELSEAVEGVQENRAGMRKRKGVKPRGREATDAP